MFGTEDGGLIRLLIYRGKPRQYRLNDIRVTWHHDTGSRKMDVTLTEEMHTMVSISMVKDIDLNEQSTGT